MVLVDSDILIEVCRGRDKGIASQWRELGQSDSMVLYSPVTSAELLAGALPREYELLDNLFRALLCSPIGDETGHRAGDYLRQYRRSHGIELGDALIASAAIENQAALWTRSRKHYPMKEVLFY